MMSDEKSIDRLEELYIKHKAAIGADEKTSTKFEKTAEKIASDISSLRGDFAIFRNDLRGGFSDFRDDLRGGFSGVRNDLQGGFSGFRDDLRGDFSGIRECIADIKKDAAERDERLIRRMIIAYAVGASIPGLVAILTVIVRHLLG